MKPLPLVYFVTAVEKQRFPVKIGRSNSYSIQGRLRTLQTSHPYKLDFLFIMEGGPDAEASLHRMLAEDKLQGEWFKRSVKLMRAMTRMNENYPDWRRLLALPHLEYDENGHRVLAEGEPY